MQKGSSTTTGLHCELGWMWVGKPGQFEEKGTGDGEGGERLLSAGQKFNPSPGQQRQKAVAF